MAESNHERGLFYKLLWLTGASQSDAADLNGEQIDWENGILSFSRKKLKPDDPPCILRIGNQISVVLKQLPAHGPLFPSMQRLKQKDRSAEFHRRCRLLKIRGISLHSYRHVWAERAEKAGMPERYAQAALGHACKAVHRAYARGAMVTVLPLEAYEEKVRNVVPFPPRQTSPKNSPVTDEALLALIGPALCKALNGANRSQVEQIVTVLTLASSARSAVSKAAG